MTDSVVVAEGGTATADFTMAAAPVQLDEIVTTATGEQRKLEVGNVVTTIDAGKIAETAPITEFSNLLSGRAAGVQVLKSSGTTGEGTRIRSFSGMAVPYLASDFRRNHGGALTNWLSILTEQMVEKIHMEQR